MIAYPTETINFSDHPHSIATMNKVRKYSNYFIPWYSHNTELM